LGTNGHGIQKLDVYEKAVLYLLSFEAKQRKWLVEQLCPKIMSKRKLQGTLNDLEEAGKIKRVYRSIDGRQTTWYVLPEHEYLLNVDEGRVLSAMDRLKRVLFRPPTVDEIAVETGVTPAVAEKLAYKLAAQTGWFNPSPELVTYAREKLGNFGVRSKN
jgi:DNA-binding HxlR family transcriptional regulator